MQPDVAPAEFTVTTAGGRRVQVLVSGPEGGLPLVFHNGTPVGLVAYGPMVAAAAARGLRMVLYTRPGYGASTPDPGRSVADAVGDVSAVLDELGAERFVTAGWSGGGPHALACAALLPERCLAAASIAGVAPYGGEGLDWLAGMAAENLDEFGAALAGPAELSAFLEATAAEMRGATAEQVVDGLGGLVSEVDQSVVTGEFAGYLAASFNAAVSTGVAGWRDDDLAFIRDWGFALGDGAPVTVWQGDQDMMVPFAHGEWLAKHVPGARAHLLSGVGHLSIGVTEFGGILDDLMSAAGAR
jgi:pimeloyl-ACP methyl ester carboxylesterase